MAAKGYFGQDSVSPAYVLDEGKSCQLATGVLLALYFWSTVLEAGRVNYLVD